jgi:RNA polymerase sigma-70 factor (ECF subfamily)
MSPPPHLSAASDQELVAWARQGREEGYRELVRRYQRPVYKLVYRMVREHELAEDLVQETFVRAFSALKSYRPEFKFSAWILRIANNTTLNHLKRKRLDTLPLDGSPNASAPRKITTRTLQLPDRSQSTPARVERRALRPALEQAIGRLKEKYQRCIILRDIEGRSYEDIAEILDLPVGTVSSYIHRARNELKAMLGPLRDALRACSSGTPA